MRSPTSFGLGQNSCWSSRGSQLPRAAPHTNHFFAVQPLNDRRRVALSLFKIGLSSLFCCLCLARLLILLLLLMSGNVHPNPCPVVPCLVCAENATWRGRSMQCCTCSNWVHLKCSLLFFSRFRTLGSSHSWRCLPCCVPAFLEIPHLSALCLPPRTSLTDIPPLLNLAHLAPFC